MFMSDISIIVRYMRTQSERVLSDSGIGFPEQLVLMTLLANGALNQEAIASRLDLDKGAIAKTIAKLESKGLVTRQPNPEDKRQKIVEATPQADGIAQAMERTLDSLNKSIFAGLTPDEVNQACALLAHMAKNAQSNEEG